MVGMLLGGDARLCFSTSLRYTFGAWLFFVGVSKFVGGAAGFVGYVESQFAQTWLPPLLTTISGWVILVAEPLVGAWLLLGRRVRLAWLAGAALMFLLMFGKTILRDFPTVADNWQYLLICLAGAALAEPEK